VKAKLEETFPKLCGGGFDILWRGPTANDLTLIRPPGSGYSVPFLPDSAGLGQAIAFIRPLQVNLNIDRVEIGEEYGGELYFLIDKNYKFSRSFSHVIFPAAACACKNWLILSWSHTHLFALVRPVYSLTLFCFNKVRWYCIVYLFWN